MNSQEMLNTLNERFSADLVCLENLFWYAAQEGYLVKETTDGVVLVPASEEDIADRLIELQDLYWSYYSRNEPLPEVYAAELEGLEATIDWA